MNEDKIANHVTAQKAVAVLLAFVLAIGLVPIAAFSGAAYATSTDGQSELYPDVTEHIEESADAGIVGEMGGKNPFADALSALFGGGDIKPVDEVLYLRYTLADAARVHEGMQIDDVFADEESIMASVMGQYNTYARMYDPGEESEYYVAMLDTTALSRAAKTIDVDFARLSDLGETVDGCVWDATTGLAYVPKALYAEEGAGSDWTMQAQVMLAFDATDMEGATTGVDTEVTWPGGSFKRPVWASPFDTTIKIDLTCYEGYADLVMSDIQLSVNDFEGSNLIEGKNAVYDAASGILEIATSPLLLLNVDVEIKGAAPFAAERAHAASKYELGTMNVLPFTMTSYDTSIPVGSYFSGRTWMHYDYDDLPEYQNAQNNIAPYQAINNNGDLAWAYNTIKNGSAWDKPLTDAENWSNSNFYVTMPHPSNGYSIPGIDLSSYYDNAVGADNYLPLTCAHVAESAIDRLDGRPVTEDGNIQLGVRVLSYDETADGRETVTLGFITARINKQSGCGVYRFYVEGKGDIEVWKHSANPDITSGNSCYELSGAVYGVYSDAACKNLVETITTDANGHGKVTVRKGYYYVKEITAPKGYALDVNAHGVNVVASQTSTLSLADEPQDDPVAMWVGKIDLETTLNMPQGSASLAGAEYTVRYYDGYYDTAEQAEASGAPKRTWVVSTNENGFAELEEKYLVRGDAFYKNSVGRVTIPLGTVLIQETKAPAGYLLCNDKVFCQKVTQEGILEAVETYDIPIHKEQAKRGDIEFVKAAENTQHRLANIPFRITSNTTGESHVVVTDANGEAKTKASWNSHTEKTNANDAAVDEEGNVDVEALDPEAGVWFGTSEPDDEHGALLFDNYRVQELRVPANEKYELIDIPTVVVSRDSYSIDLGTLDNQPELVAFLKTTARNSADGTKYASADPATNLVDRIEYRDVYAGGKSYTVKTTLMDRTTGEPVKDAEGNDVSAEAKLVPERTEGFVEVPLQFDSRNVAGRDVVFFEELVDDETGKPVAEHKDIEDYDQSVRVLPVEVGTTATDAADGGKTLACAADAKISDAVSYRNLVPGAEYVANATLVEVAYDELGNVQASPLLVDGEAVTASVAFTPKDPTGEVEVAIPVDATLLAGRTVVVYESVTRDGEEVARHEDPTDAGQTVRFAAPEVKTVLGCADGAKTVRADAECSLVDAVTLENAAAGHSYKAYGMLVDRERALPLLGYQDGDNEASEDDTDALAAFAKELFESAFGEDAQQPEGGAWEPDLPAAFDADAAASTMKEAKHAGIASRMASAEGEVVAEAKTASAELTYRLDARGLAGKTAVSCVVVVDEATGDAVAVEADLGCEDQSVEFVTEKIGTLALDKTDGDHQLLNSADAVVVDTVDYENLVPGKEYVLRGVLYDKATGEPLLVADKQVTSEKSFVPVAASGEVDVEFAFDASGLDGHDLVVFEKLFRVQATLDGGSEDVEVASHEDIGSDAQTVKVAKPVVGTGYDKTGNDVAAMAALMSMFAAAGAGIFAYYNREQLASRFEGLVCATPGAKRQ